MRHWGVRGCGKYYYNLCLQINPETYAYQFAPESQDRAEQDGAM